MSETLNFEPGSVISCNARASPNGQTLCTLNWPFLEYAHNTIFQQTRVLLHIHLMLHVAAFAQTQLCSMVFKTAVCAIPNILPLQTTPPEQMHKWIHKRDELVFETSDDTV